MALTLLTLTAFAIVIGGLVMTAQATETNSTTTDTTKTTIDQSSFPLRGLGGIMTGEQGFGMGPRGRGGHGMGSMGVEVSSEYNATVNAILDADTDVQNLISEGYCVTSIHPIVKSVIGADGAVTIKATTAMVLLQNGTSGIATVSVDVTNAKVTEIVVITRTVIDKTSS